ncbi:hypothetical protein KVT40_007997 [Elsinoe batatas]|uniref:Endosomal/vacuolar adapter protein YPT35 n=1 Tax=Elsinoe batatas TaxID=2601811 RepID=A0A8K0KSD9_9PEZI|nr:hypothetical protein KVT40_007997 [Elsinoe batatas]
MEAEGDRSVAATAEPAAARDNETALLHSPPFWNRHGRSVSEASSILKPSAISLEDHTDEDDHSGCWAKHVSIDDYVVISGSTGIGAYVVWSCTVETLKGAPFTIRKRFSEFDKLRSDLVRAFPHAEASIPPLPRKSVISRFRPKFLDARKAGLSHFLHCILLNPEFAGSPILRDFVFS